VLAVLVGEAGSVAVSTGAAGGLGVTFDPTTDTCPVIAPTATLTG
jgi:hypothetical protein